MDCARAFSPCFSVRPLSQIIYVGNNLSNGYKQALMKIGQDLNIKVHICLGGTSSDKFLSAWKYQTKLYEKQQKKIFQSKDDRIKNDEDDEDDENDEDNENYDKIKNLKSSSVFFSRGSSSFGKNEKCERDDSCASFLKRMANVNTAKRTKRNGPADRNLQRRPRVQGSMSRYLTLKDPSVLNTRNFALSRRTNHLKENDVEENKRGIKGGAVLTRAARKKQLEMMEEGEPSSSSRSPQGSQQRASKSTDGSNSHLIFKNKGGISKTTPTSNGSTASLKMVGNDGRGRKRRRGENIIASEERMESEREREGGKSAELEKRRRRRSGGDTSRGIDQADNTDVNDKDERKRMEEENKKGGRIDANDEDEDVEMRFMPETLLILDDIFVSSVNEYSSSRESKEGSSGKNRLTFERKEKENVSQAMNIACRLVLELSHHWRINTIISHQGTLNSSGSNFISRGMRILRNNTDAFIRT